MNHLEIEEDFTAPEITLGQPNGLISCITPVVQIDGNDISPDGYTNLIEWTEYEGELLDPLLLNPSTQWPGSFGLTVTFEENGCSTSTTETVEVEQDEYAFISLESLVIPNIFTPNGECSKTHPPLIRVAWVFEPTHNNVTAITSIFAEKMRGHLISIQFLIDGHSQYYSKMPKSKSLHAG